MVSFLGQGILRISPDPSIETDCYIASAGARGCGVDVNEAALILPRIHFAFGITFHYLFPQLTTSLAGQLL